MKIANFRLKQYWLLQVFLFAIIFILSSNLIFAQSNDQKNPTAITGNEIEGEIQPRSVGDPRLTNYYFTFNANQGDVFINVVTNNLDGDIDVFIVDSLEPLTKIPVFAGVQDNETGRVIYLRKPESLILRIQGRTPNDEPAKYQIKFAGSFVALERNEENDKTDLPAVEVENQGVARVNSVGTIIEVLPTSIPEREEKIVEQVEETKLDETEQPAKEIVIGGKSNETSADATRIEITKEPVVEEKTETEVSENANNQEQKKDEKSALELIFSDIFGDQNRTDKTKDEIPEKVAGKSDADRNSANTGAEISAGLENKGIVPGEVLKSEKTEDRALTETIPKEIQPVEPEQLSNINLVVRFKNGTKFKRSMDRVVWFNIEKGILTIITDDGNILKFSMLDVEKVNFDTDNLNSKS